jgi:hypothetical protein
MHNRLEGDPPPTESFHEITNFQVHSEMKQNCQSPVQIMTLVLKHHTCKLDESCLWMVDCRSIVVDGGAKCYKTCYTVDDRSKTNTIFVKMGNSSNPRNIYASRDFYKAV